MPVTVKGTQGGTQKSSGNSVMLGSLHHTHKHPVASVPLTTILLSPLASRCAGNFSGRRTFFFAIRPTYCTDLGGCDWDNVEQTASPEHLVCLFRRCTEDKKHVLLLTQQDVLTFLSINPSHTQMKSVEAVCLAQKTKQKKSQPTGSPRQANRS